MNSVAGSTELFTFYRAECFCIGALRVTAGGLISNRSMVLALGIPQQTLHRKSDTASERLRTCQKSTEETFAYGLLESAVLSMGAQP